jgi:hypothetical protein
MLQSLCVFYGFKNIALKAENTERKTQQCPISTHAEMALLQKLSERFYRLHGKRKPKPTIDILVVRFSKEGVLGYSHPCAHCLKRLQSNKWPFRVRHVYYTLCPGIIVRERTSQMIGSLSSGYLYRQQ